MDQAFLDEISLLVKAHEFLKTLSFQQKDYWRTETISQRYARINDMLYQQTKGVIQNGYFKSMTISQAVSWQYSHIGQMILGIYETPVINFIYDNRFSKRDLFIDIGAADGYYPVGLLFAKRMSKAVAFESSSLSQKSILSNATLNNVQSSLDILGAADEKSVLELSLDFSKAVILVDIEGAEFDLLSATVLNTLRKAVIIVEIHHWVTDFPEKIASLINRAKKHFKVDFAPDMVPDSSFLQLISHWPDDNRYLIMSEGRPSKMKFLTLIPKGSA